LNIMHLQALTEHRRTMKALSTPFLPDARPKQSPTNTALKRPTPDPQQFTIKFGKRS
jgi:hypothetical protein